MKIFSFSKKSDRIFPKLVLYVSGIIVITIAMASILYFYFEKIALENISSSSRDTLSQISYSSTFITDWVKTIGLQIYNDPDISSIFYLEKGDTQGMNNSLRKLRAFRNSMPFIHSIYMYSRDNGIYTSVSGNEISDRGEFFDQDVIKILDDFSSYKRFVPITRKLAEPYSPHNYPVYSNVYTYIYYVGPERGKDLSLAIIINISEQWLRKTMSALDADTKSDIFVIENTGKTVCITRKYDMLSNLSDQSFIKRILSSTFSSGSFIEDVDGIKSLVTYVSSKALQWKYIRVTSYDLIFQKINQWKKTTFLVAALILFFCVLFSLFSSLQIYKPVKGFLDKMKSMDAEKRKTQYPLKQELLKNILSGAAQYPPDVLGDKFRELDIKLDVSRDFLLIILKIDRYPDFCRKFDTNDRNLMRFAISNIASELVGTLFVSEPADMGDDHVALIINGPGSDDHSLQQSLEEVIRKIQESVSQYLEISLTAVLNPAGHMAGDLEAMYAECRDAAQYRMFSGYMSLIRAGKVNAPKRNEFVYPAEKGKVLIDALIQGKFDLVKLTYREILNEAINWSYTAFTMTLLRLTFSISMAVDVIEKNRKIPVSYDFNDFYLQLTRNEVLDEVHQQFYAMFDHISSKFDELNRKQYYELADKVNKVIEKKYTDQNLSLESIADDLNMSSIYLGRQYKKLTSRSVADSINEFRIMKAVELIKSTALPIKEISDKVGFTNKCYFFTLFKKLQGVTPNEFRQCGSHTLISS